MGYASRTSETVTVLPMSVLRPCRLPTHGSTYRLVSLQSDLVKGTHIGLEDRRGTKPPLPRRLVILATFIRRMARHPLHLEPYSYIRVFQLYELKDALERNQGDSSSCYSRLDRAWDAHASIKPSLNKRILILPLQHP